MAPGKGWNLNTVTCLVLIIYLWFALVLVLLVLLAGFYYYETSSVVLFLDAIEVMALIIHVDISGLLCHLLYIIDGKYFFSIYTSRCLRTLEFIKLLKCLSIWFAMFAK